MADQCTDGQQAVSESKEMKIHDAKEMFSKFGDDFRPDLESLVHLIRTSNICEPLENSNYLHALSLTEMMFIHTSHSFRMMTGSAVDGFLSCLKESFMEMLSRVTEANGIARMILVHEGGGEEVDSPVLKEARQRFASHFEFVSVNVPRHLKLTHFIACDDDMVRDEAWHTPLTAEAGANEVKAKVFFKNKTMAKSFNSRFDTLWTAMEKK